MSLNQCMQEHTRRQYLAWQYWLDEQQKFASESESDGVMARQRKPETVEQSKQRWFSSVGLKKKANGS